MSHHKNTNTFTLRILTILFLWLFARWVAASPPETLLKRYIDYDDGAYGYEIITTLDQPGFTIHIARLTSQNWRAASEVDRILWEHALIVVVPDNLSTTKSLLVITGGDNDDDFLTPSASDLERLANLAVASGSIVTNIQQVPNQPLFFTDEPDVEASEDELVAYSLDTAMGTSDLTWAAYLPMTKSAVKAMDAVQDISAELGLAPPPEEFVVTGFSKRGAITWLTAAADARVVAIAPAVFDTLNLAPAMEHQRGVYGQIPEPLADYTFRNVFDRFRIREGRRLLRIIDPYAYRRSLTLPKYILNVAGDEFYPPDSSRFYLSELAGETRIRYVANTNHGGAGGGLENIVAGLLAWYQRLIAASPRPDIHWDHAQPGLLTVTTDTPAIQARLWSATNPEARDFRYMTFGPNWVNRTLSPNANGDYVATVDTPAAGWTGYYVELVYEGVAGLAETYSTPVFVTPDTLAFTLDQPVGVPRDRHYWKVALDDYIDDPIDDPDAPLQPLTESFPIHILGDVYVKDIETARDLLLKNPQDKRTLALQECLATRLNIKTGELGWYSKLQTLGLHVWKLWNVAEWLFGVDVYGLASDICDGVNNRRQ